MLEQCGRDNTLTQQPFELAAIPFGLFKRVERGPEGLRQQLVLDAKWKGAGPGFLDRRHRNLLKSF
jgi:hypothetical protein